MALSKLPLSDLSSGFLSGLSSGLSYGWSALGWKPDESEEVICRLFYRGDDANPYCLSVRNVKQFTVTLNDGITFTIVFGRFITRADFSYEKLQKQWNGNPFLYIPCHQISQFIGMCNML